MEPASHYIDRSKFGKTVETCAIKFLANNASKYLKDYKEFLLNMEKSPNIPKEYNEEGYKLLLLNPQYKKDEFASWPEKLKSLVETNKYELVDYQVKLNYEDLNIQEVLQQILPKDVVIPGGFETVGNIAHLNLRSSQLPYKNIIGQVILDKNSKIKTIVNKTEKLSNVFRTPELEVIAGENNLETELKEGGCIYRLNFEKVYWNSKLQAERDRLLAQLKPNEVLCDMFCGIGPLSIRAAKKGLRVLANDLNPMCYEYLQINAKLNKVEKLVECYNMDAREFMKDMVLNRENKVHIDHIYMNLPVDAVEFLDAFNGLFQTAPQDVWNQDNLPTIHVNGFDGGKDLDEVKKNFRERMGKAFGRELDENFSFSIHQIKDISSEKKMYCLTFKLPYEIAYGALRQRDATNDEEFDKIEKKVKLD